MQKRFGGVFALRDASIEFTGPKICGLVGANGSGKTTFARLCCGIYDPDCGEIFINGKRIEIKNPDDAQKYKIVLAHQNLSLIPDLTVWENIKLGRETKKCLWVDNDADRKLAREIIEEMLPGEISLDTRVEDLNPAHKQMVEIAKALSQEPELLILDEPTAALEFYQVKQLFKKIRELKANNTSVILISHRLWEITEVCDLVFAFRDGKYVGSIDFDEQVRDENLIVPFVTGENEEKVYFLKKKKNTELQNEPVTIALENVSFGKKLKNITFSGRKGEVIGIGGLNGQGQEELIMVLAGALRTNSGVIRLNGKEVRLHHPKHAVKNGIFLVPGDRNVDGLFNTHSVFNNEIFPRLSMKTDRPVINFSGLNAITDEMIQKVELTPPDRKAIVKNLSGGNQQKIVFGRWLQFIPTVLLLNDPAKGIDIQAKEALYNLTKELTSKGTTVILYASSNEELINNCDRTFIMFEGKIVEEFQYEALNEGNLIKSSLRVGGEVE